MDNHIKKLVKSTPNDQELGAKVREYINSQRTCCNKKENIGTYTDYKGQEFDRCNECGKLINL